MLAGPGPPACKASSVLISIMLTDIKFTYYSSVESENPSLYPYEPVMPFGLRPHSGGELNYCGMYTLRYVYHLVISIDLSETAHFAHWKSKTTSETIFFLTKFFPTFCLRLNLL